MNDVGNTSWVLLSVHDLHGEGRGCSRHRRNTATFHFAGSFHKDPAAGDFHEDEWP